MPVRTGVFGPLMGCLAAVAGLLILAGCDAKKPAAGAVAAEEASAVAALVNGRPIYVSDVQLEAEAQDMVDKHEKLEVDSAEFNQVLDQLIDVKLLAMEAESRGLDEEPASRHRLDSAREHILGNILVDALVDEKVDEAAIKKMYDAQIAIWELGEEAHIRHIVVSTKDEIDDVVAQLNKGADFTVLASKVSIDEATRMEGGDLGYMSEDEAAPEFAKVIRTTPTGGLSKPFETDMGWHVAKIDDRRKKQPPSIEELREPILKHLTMMQIGEELKLLRTKAKIERRTSPQNSTLEVDPAPLDEKKPAAPVAGATPEAGPAPAAPASTPDAKPPAATPAPASAATKPAATPAPATTKPAPAATKPATDAKPPAATATKPPAATPAPAPAKPPTPAPTSTPAGPVSETRTPPT